MKHNTNQNHGHRKYVHKFLLTLTVIFGLFTSNLMAQNYCASAPQASFKSFTQRVVFADIDNPSWHDGGYGDYTNLTANVQSGMTYQMRLRPNTKAPYNTIPSNWRVWIDFNANGDFTDPGEMVMETTSIDPVVSSITIPNSLEVLTRMRITNSLYNHAASCGPFVRGEVEDYTISITNCIANAGTITADATPVCLDNGSAMLSATPDGNANVPAGYSTVYVLTSGTGLVIEQAGASPSFTVNTGGSYTIHTLIYDPNTLDLNIVVPGQTTGFDVNGLLVQGGGSICASLDVAGAAIVVEDPNAGTITADATPVCLDKGSAMLSATPDGNANVPAGYSTVYVLTSGTGLVIEQAGASPSFTVNTGGSYTIHTLIYDPNTLDLNIVVPGQTTGFDVNGLLVQGGGSICASLDVAGAQFDVVSPNAGTITADATPICLDNGSAMLSATPDGNANVPAGYQTVYVLTSGTGLVIEQAGASPSFTVNTGGSYTIHTLIYDPNTLDLNIVVPGQTTGFDVNGLLVQGGGSICASLDVAGAAIVVEDPNAGTITADATPVCLDKGSAMLSATPDGNANVPAGYSTVYVLTSGTGLVIEQAGASPSFTVNTGGSYTIHTLIYDPNTLDLNIVVPGQTTGFDVNGLLVQGGGSICASLDVAGAQFDVVSPNAGTITADATPVCLDNGSAMLSATPDGNANVPAGYQTVYVLTSGTGLVIEQAGASPSFTVNTGGSYTIHTLIYDPNTLDLNIVVPGQTTGFDVNGLLVQGGGSICASLDVAGAAIVVEDPNAGTITADATPVCLDNGSAMLSATPDGNANVPAGYSTVYVLTSGTGLVIEQAGASPSFTVNTGGSYTIHTLIYDPNTLDLNIVVPGQTTGFDVNGLLVQGGGSICASLDVAGAQFDVVSPNAGTITADATPVCLDNGSAMLSATPDGNANVPAGYSTVYVLTSGTGLVIEQAGASPSFTVNTGGSYTIHTLIYDPNTLDLNIVVPGQTTGFDVNGLLVQGGGSICASLDVAGAQFDVVSPNAGTITADATPVCLDNGSAMLSATPDGNANVPAGYSTVYVLTSGTGLVIEQAGASPSFTVNTGGSYTIHTLIYDPNTLDLNIVVPGQTTGFDVNGLLVQGGGSICASLDVTGAQFVVEAPNAGTIHPEHFINCLSYNSSVQLEGIPSGNSNVPNGYQTVYVLTKGQGLVIEQAGANPMFSVTAYGVYRIHTLVYDPATLDLNIVVPGQTTGFDVNGLLVQGGGSICASLDVTGAPFVVIPNWICNLFGGVRNTYEAYDQNDPEGVYENIMSEYSEKTANEIADYKLSLYPNPAVNQLNFKLEGVNDETVTIEIYNVFGQLILTERYGNLNNESNIDISALPSGMYIFNILTGDQKITERFKKL